MLSRVNIAVYQCVWFNFDANLPQDQSVKRVLKYIKGTSTNRPIINMDPEKVI